MRDLDAAGETMFSMQVEVSRDNDGDGHLHDRLQRKECGARELVEACVAASNAVRDDDLALDTKCHRGAGMVAGEIAVTDVVGYEMNVRVCVVKFTSISLA